METLTNDQVIAFASDVAMVGRTFSTP